MTFSNISFGSELQKGKGEVADFVLAQILKRGGRPLSMNDLPEIGGEWSYFEDEYGAVIHLEKARFDAVQGFLFSCLGEPSQIPTNTTDGGRMGWYAARSVGASVQFGHDGNNSFIHILQPVQPKEIVERLEKMTEESP